MKLFIVIILMVGIAILLEATRRYFENKGINKNYIPDLVPPIRNNDKNVASILYLDAKGELLKDNLHETTTK